MRRFFMISVVLLLHVNAYASDVEFKMVSSAAGDKKINNMIPVGYSLKVGSFGEEVNAEQFAAKLKAKGVDAYYFKKNNSHYNVHCGGFSTRQAARESAEKLIADKIISSYFIASPNDISGAKILRPTKIYSVQPVATGDQTLIKSINRIEELQKQDARRFAAEDSTIKLELKRIEKILKSKRFKVKFYSECTLSSNPMERIVSCKMFFPSILDNMRYVHEIEAFTRDIAVSFARNNTVAFEIYAVMKDRGDKEAALRVKQSKVKGDYIPVCAYAYSKRFDRLDSVWNQL